MPRLKVGDTFLITKEIAAAKRKTCYDNPCDRMLGMWAEIVRVDIRPLNPCYVIRPYQGCGTGFLFSIVDPYLERKERIDFASLVG